MQRESPTTVTAHGVNLRNPTVAAVLAWLWPGGGHFYQRRYFKGTLFMCLILVTFFYGLALADGRAVYAQWTPQHKRYNYLPQVAVGLPALPALVEARRARAGAEPLLGGWYAPPRDADELNEIHRRYHRYFELGTVYTMIAGLLNVLVIYDAWGGPAYVREDDQEEEKAKRGEKDGPPADSKPPP